MFICHTLPDARYLDALDLELLKVDRWPAEATKRGGTIYALTWGRDTDPETADRFAAMVDADWFITGHQPCDEGFRQANHRQIIIDGTDPYPAYCLFSAPRARHRRVAPEVRAHPRRSGRGLKWQTFPGQRQRSHRSLGHHAHERAEVDGLDEMMVEARNSRLQEIFFLAESGHRDNPGVLAEVECAKPPGDFVAVHRGQPDVEQQHIGPDTREASIAVGPS